MDRVLLTDRVLQEAVGEDPAMRVQRAVSGTQEEFGWKGSVWKVLAGED